MSVADKPFVRTSILAAEPPPPARGEPSPDTPQSPGNPEGRDPDYPGSCADRMGRAAPRQLAVHPGRVVRAGPHILRDDDQGGIQPDGWSGACWAFISAKYDQFIFGRYPLDERWRPAIVGILFILLLVPMLIPSAPRKGLNAILLFAVLPVLAFWLLHGGFGLEVVDTPLWGGLMVTLVLSFVGIAVSLPCGILLALGRRSKMPVIRMLCVTFIEVIRGVPLITVLFMASVMLPLFLPTGWNVDKLLRALIGVSIFTSAYMAEVIRGGLQAIPKGQFEGADSLGLGYWQKTRLIIMPQAIKLVIPSIVNTFIGTFKDTSLVTIIGMFDLLGIVKLNFSDANWASAVTPITGLIFAGFIFWLFCFGMSRYSGFMERHLDTGHKR